MRKLCHPNEPFHYARLLRISYPPMRSKGLLWLKEAMQLYAGGAFCLLEYGIQIPLQPGDLLITATAREWHRNVTPVQGEKYSIVAYYRTGVDNPKMKPGKSVPS